MVPVNNGLVSPSLARLAEQLIEHHRENTPVHPPRRSLIRLPERELAPPQAIRLLVHHQRRRYRIPKARHRITPHHRALPHCKANLLTVTDTAEFVYGGLDQRLRLTNGSLIRTRLNARLNQPTHRIGQRRIQGLQPVVLSGADLLEREI
jgi:hypothetical protein